MTTKRPLINSANPSILLNICESLRVHFKSEYGCRETEWVAYFIHKDCASIKDEFGVYWDIDTITKKIIPA